MEHEIVTYAAWCNDSSADLTLFCRTCGEYLLEVNSRDKVSEVPPERLAELAAEHRGMKPA